MPSGFVRVLENLESPGTLLWHFPGLESPGKRPLVLKGSGNLKNKKCMEGSKENLHWGLGGVEVNVNFRALEKSIWVLEKSWKFVFWIRVRTLCHVNGWSQVAGMKTNSWSLGCSSVISNDVQSIKVVLLQSKVDSMQTEVMHYSIQNLKTPEIIIEFPRIELTFSK